MDYLIAKEDLAILSPKDITALVNHFDVHTENHNDQLWLLALAIHFKKKSEMPPGESEEGLPDPNLLVGMPNELLFETLKELDPPDIVSVCRVNKQLNEKVCESNVFWERYVRNRFPSDLLLYSPELLAELSRKEGGWKSIASEVTMLPFCQESTGRIKKIIGKVGDQPVYVIAGGFVLPRDDPRLQTIIGKLLVRGRDKSIVKLDNRERRACIKKGWTVDDEKAEERSEG